jgi:HEAT repeat protein
MVRIAWLLALGILGMNGSGGADGPGIVTPAQNKSTQGQTLDEWEKMLDSDDDAVNLKAARAMIAMDDPAYAVLAEALSNPYRPIWKRTVESMVTIGEPAVPALLAVIRLERSGDLRHNGGIAAIQRMGEAALPGLKKAIESNDAEVRMSAIVALRLQMMTPHQSTALELLAEIIASHNDPATRASAAEGIGYAGLMQIPDPSAAVTLSKALQDPDDDVQAMAAVGLVRLKAWRGKNIIEPLIRALDSRNPEARMFAVEALGQIGPAAEKAIPALVATMERQEAFLADEAAEALGKIGAAALPAVLQLLGGAEDDLLPYIVKALAGIGPDAESALPKLIELLESKDAMARAAAAQALGEMGGKGDSIQALTSALLDDDPQVQAAVVYAIASIGSAAAPAVPGLITLLKETEDFRQSDILRALGSIGPAAEEAIPAIEAAVTSNALAAGKALGRIGPASVPVLIRLLSHEKADVRTWAAWALRYLGPDAHEAVPALVDLINTDEKARNFAIQALGAIGPKAAPAIPVLTSMLGESDPALRSWALDTVRRIGPEAKDARDAVLKLMTSDDDPHLEWSAVTALIAMGCISDGLPVVLKRFSEDDSLRATELLIEMGPKAQMAAAQVADKMVDDNSPLYLRIMCAKALAKITPEEDSGVAFLKDQLRKPNEPLVMASALALAELGQSDDDVVKVLEAGLESRDVQLAVACAGALAGVPARRDAGLRVLRDKLQENDRDTRVAASLALAAAGVADPKAIEILKSEMRLQDGSGNPIEAVRALGNIARQDKAARVVLQEALHNESERVREAAMRAMAGWE